MKKALYLLLVLMLICVSGCGKKTKEESKEITNEFKIRNITFKFDKDGTFNDFSYKYSSKIKLNESEKTTYLTYENDDIVNGKFVFRISLYSKENTNIKTIFNESKYNNYKTKKINNITWNVYVSDVDNVKTLIFATEKNNNVYITNIAIYKKSEVDLDNLADVFMNGVSIK